MFCSNCGAKIVEGGQFCSDCGTKVAPAPTTGFSSDFASEQVQVPPGADTGAGAAGKIGGSAAASEANTNSGWAQPQTIYVQKKTESLAVASLVMSILGIVFVLPFIGSILGIVFGKMAQNKIDESNGALAGEGLASAGMIIGIIGLVLLILGAIAIALFFGALFSTLSPPAMHSF